MLKLYVQLIGGTFSIYIDMHDVYQHMGIEDVYYVTRTKDIVADYAV